MAEPDAKRAAGSAIALLAAALALLLSVDAAAEASCGKGSRVNHRDAECLSANWNNRGVLRKSPDPGVSGLARGARAVTAERCRTRFHRRGMARHSCWNVTADTSIAGETENCVVMAECQRTNPVDILSRHSGITLPFDEVGDLFNCDGILTLGPCPQSWDGQGVLSVSDAETGEGPGASLVFMVTLFGIADATVEVDYATANGTASEGSDYSAASGTLTFRRHDLAKAVTVPVLDDGHDEPAETVVLRLSNPRRARIADPEGTGTIRNGDETQSPALTVAYTTAPPAEHDGENEFNFQIAFSEAPDSYSYRTLRDDTLRIEQGDTRLTPSVNRLEWGKNRRWNVRVTPTGKGDITIAVGSDHPCTHAYAVCTEDDRALANSLSATVQDPAGLSVADATGQEAADATLDFAVTLSRASTSQVMVDYATSDGTATAGSDYTATSGTLAFAVGETEKTVSVPVLDDSIDEGEETFTLTLSNPQGGNGAYLADAVATGTIENADAMPRAWLARFGRTVAEQVIEAVEGRFSAPRAAGAEMTLAGERIGLSGAGPEDPGPGGGDARAEPDEAEARSRLAAMVAWLRGAEDADGGRAGYGSRAVTPRDLLTGSSFALTGEAKAGGTVSLWGRGAVSRFDGREGALTLDGEVASMMLGADWARDRWTTGLLVSRSVGEGGYRGVSAGTVESTLTGFFPYGRYAASERVTLWGVAGYGTGELVLTPEGQPAMRTDMDLAMGAVGLRGVAVEAPAEGGFELAVKNDAMAVRTTSEKVAGMESAEADVTRLRLGLEGTYRGLTLGTGTLAPTAEIALRHDGGDAETGFGVDLGGGLAWWDPENGLSAEFRGRGLLTHESQGFRDRGVSGSFAWAPGERSGRGPSLTLTQTVGASATGGADALFGQRHLGGLAANDNEDDLENRRLELRMGYGFSALGDRFTSTPEFGLGLSNGNREYSLGWRLVHGGSAPDGNTLELAIEARRGERAANDKARPEHAAAIRVTSRF